MTDPLVDARAAHRRGEWSAARALFLAAGELGPADLHTLSDVEWWLGHVREARVAAEAAAVGLERVGAMRQAAMAAIDLAGMHFLRGEETLGSTWLSQAHRLLRDHPDSVERVYLDYLEQVEPAQARWESAAVIDAATRLRERARVHGDPNLPAMTTMAEGRAMVRQGQVAAGFALVEDSMAAALARGLKPEWIGYLYCNLVGACHELVDLARMRVWTEALSAWCSTLPDEAVFSGICQVHQAQLRQVRGDWAGSETDAARAGADLRELSVAGAAEAHYVVAEARRLRGDLTGAEQAYLAAHDFGRDPQPGMALLRLAQGRPDVALRSIQSALIAEDRGLLRRVRLCAAAVEIAVAAAAIDVARKAADELDEAARDYDSSGLRAMAWHAQGAVRLAEGNPEEALPVLRRACAQWRELGAAYDCARVRLLLAQAYDALGDRDASERERAAAKTVLTRLGASVASPNPDGLTTRELDVLALVAAGKSNREVAAELVLSDKTVARHLANIYLKLNLSSRTAAAGYAFDHGLVARTDA
ncbi:regulatory protein, luxR family [Actinokineospora alba]|uniref:Regulatory protein, luxR family n=1 Tax=Actinokineospora alba TaxID=504798 RepID=A0A1H0W4M6_9PSEU|nr:LuxR C-terminal-related transcriptional regulator [Actinokineospora alba]TDP67854.1 regulatory LuxR family protein [Actinokineospora alba]SDI73098.1 regulatory protein, luxR family [Actinokineospora alba]SDP85528.1 regulatory protein, luxR family [Actinokineospora alba]